jgi:nitroreductase
MKNPASAVPMRFLTEKFSVAFSLRWALGAALRKKARRGIRSLVNATSPRWVDLVSNYLYDFQRYRRWSATVQSRLSRENLWARIMMEAHRLEKGLSLQSPRPGFGRKAVERLLEGSWEFHDRFGVDQILEVAVNVLAVYNEFNTAHGISDPNLVAEVDRLRRSIESSSACTSGGVTHVRRVDILQSAKMDLSRFFASRHSIRQFADEPVSIDLVRRAVNMALHTPSVCNRQAWKVYVFSDPERKKRVLSHQNGNRGFGEQIGHVAIITSNLQRFVSVGERNQAWIDGGMFAMSFVLALHSLGLGTCCLNWSVEQKADIALRAEAAIPDSEVIIMLLAIGQIPPELNVAASVRQKFSLLVEC